MGAEDFTLDFIQQRLDEELFLEKTLENQADMLNMLLPHLGEDEDIVNVYKEETDLVCSKECH